MIQYQLVSSANMSTAPPVGLDIHEDQRGRLVGAIVSVIVITDVFVLLRLVSRKLARVGYWVKDPLALGFEVCIQDWNSMLT